MLGPRQTAEALRVACLIHVVGSSAKFRVERGARWRTRFKASKTCAVAPSKVESVDRKSCAQHASEAPVCECGRSHHQ